MPCMRACSYELKNIILAAIAKWFAEERLNGGGEGGHQEERLVGCEKDQSSNLSNKC